MFGGFIALLATLSATALAGLSSLLGNLALFGVIIAFLLLGAWKKVPVYESFIEGARQGFDIARDLLPYLVAMLCAVGVLRASGALDAVLDGIRWLAHAANWDTRFVDALPTALVKPFSGSAARAMMLDTMAHFGVDSFPALLAATMQGSTETTFYVLAVYFGAVGVRRAPCRGLRAAGRPGRRAGLDRRLLLVFRLSPPPKPAAWVPCPGMPIGRSLTPPAAYSTGSSFMPLVPPLSR